ncbi:hypothetical protein EDD16DRAFT_1728168 [Pisolithus croceorrhizus]|nr:hypothetical protein EDD16DRAFT_1728168 [Pisolithus croceorrhizus]
MCRLMGQISGVPRTSLYDVTSSGTSQPKSTEGQIQYHIRFIPSSYNPWSNKNTRGHIRMPARHVIIAIIDTKSPVPEVNEAVRWAQISRRAGGDDPGRNVKTFLPRWFRRRRRSYESVLAKSYLHYALARLGCKATVFILVHANNEARISVWEKPAFMKAGQIPEVGRLKCWGRATVPDYLAALMMF